MAKLGPYLKDYMLVVRKAYTDNNSKLGAFNKDFSFLTLPVMNKLNSIMAEAINSVKQNSNLLVRVEKEKLSLDYAWVYLYGSLKNYSAVNSMTFKGPQNLSSSASDLLNKMKGWGIKK